MVNVGETMVAALLVMFVNAILILIAAWPVSLLWNGALVPAVSGLSEIGYWQAIGLMLLVKLFVDMNIKATIK